MKKADKEKKRELRKRRDSFLCSTKAQKRRIRKFFKAQEPRKKHLALKITSLTLLTGILALTVTNSILSSIYNSSPPRKDPFTTDNVIDSNDNDFDVGDDDQIIADTFSDEEKQALSDTFLKFLLGDAQNRSSDKIDSIDKLVSISMFPYNQNEESNTFDKYNLSILFESNGNTYAMNYLTGQNFESTAEYTKDFVSDFIYYLAYGCAIDTCQKMNDKTLSLKSALGDEVNFVGDPFLSYNETGDTYYFIPAYTSTGDGTVYYAWASEIDAFKLNPIDVLESELTSGTLEQFASKPFETSIEVKAAEQILQEIMTRPEQGKAPEISEEEGPSK